MRLTTKLLKEIIKEELDNMTEEESPILAVADAVGVQMEEEQIEEEAIVQRNPQLEEGMEALDYLASLPPEQLEAIISYVAKLIMGGMGVAGVGAAVTGDPKPVNKED